MANSASAVFKSNKQHFIRDISRFLHLDKTFHDRDIQFSDVKGRHELSLDCAIGDLKAEKKFTFTIDGILTLPDHSKRTIPLIQTTVEKDGQVEFNFIQDKEMTGEPVKFLRQLKEPYEYSLVRNQLVGQLHSLLETNYTQQDSKRLIRKFLETLI